MILDLFCALSIVLILVLFYFHLRAFVFPATVFSLSDSLSELANLRFGLSPKFRVQNSDQGLRSVFSLSERLIQKLKSLSVELLLTC